jgi:hypothetical protein
MVLALAAYAQDNQSVPAGEYWYKITMQGQSAGYVHNVSEKTRYQGQECYKSLTEAIMKLKNDDKIIEVKIDIISYSDLNFNPLYLKEEKRTGSRQSILEIFVSDNEILFKEISNDRLDEKRIAYEREAIWDIDGFMLKKKNLLKVGTACSFKSIARKRKSMGAQTIKILKEEKISIRGQDTDTFYLEIIDSEFPGIIIKNNIDKEGALVRSRFEGFEMILTDEADAKKEENIASVSSEIDTNVVIPFVNKITRMEVVLTINTEDESGQAIPKNEYQTVKKEGNQYNLILKSIPLNIKTVPTSPIIDKNLAVFLKPTAYVQSDDPAIVTKVKEILNDEQNSLEAVKKIGRWVYDNIKQEKIKTMNLSAKETLEKKAGDCTEHAALFCALARAGGVPTRIIHGLIFSGEAFGYHQWNEVYLGEWVPVDTTCNRIGIPAGYIKTSDDETDYAGAPSSAAVMLKMMGQTSIKILAFNDSVNQRIDVSDKNKYFIEQDNSIEDKRAGIRLIKPDKWKTLMGPKEKNLMMYHIDKSLMLAIIYSNLEDNLSVPKFINLIGKLTDGFNESPIYEMKVSQYPAFAKEIFKKDKNNKEVKEIYILTQGNGKTFFIIMTAPKDAFPVAQEDFNAILQSIQF